MKLTTIIYLFLLTLLLIAADAKKDFTYSGNNQNQICEDGYTYDRVFEGGIWWIYVYDTDGRLINIYPDED